MSSTPEQREKWRQAWKKKAKAKRARHQVVKMGRPKNSVHHDAIIYLRNAEREINREMRAGKIKKLPKSSLLTLLALSALTDGEMIAG